MKLVLIFHTLQIQLRKVLCLSIKYHNLSHFFYQTIIRIVYYFAGFFSYTYIYFTESFLKMRYMANSLIQAIFYHSSRACVLKALLSALQNALRPDNIGKMLVARVSEQFAMKSILN